MSALTQRTGGPGDAILGATPRQVFEPSSTREAAQVMAHCGGAGLALAVVGGGTALGLGRAPTSLDAVVRTGKMARILEYAPADMVLVAEAGVTLAALQAAAHAHRQRLALDPPNPEQATVGGLVAVGAAGPLRARYGTVRDLIIGVTLVRADGRVAKSGGKVVKNVAGFDLPKIACGSLGTLAMVASANFRLHPEPELSATAFLPGLGAERVVQLVLQVREAQLEPAAAIALRAAGGVFDLEVVFEGFAAGVRQQLARLQELARALGTSCEPLSDPAAASVRAGHDSVRSHGGLRVRVAALPTLLPTVDVVVGPVLGALSGGAFAWYPSAGLGWISGEPGDPQALVSTLDAARARLVQAGGSLVLEAAPGSVRAAMDPWGPVPPSFALMERLKQRFDPARRLNPGRYVGGL